MLMRTLAAIPAKSFTTQAISALRKIPHIATVSLGILTSGVVVIVQASIRMIKAIIITIVRNTAATVTSALLIDETEEQRCNIE